MTEDQFKTRSFKYSMPLKYIYDRSGKTWDCLLIAVDFDNDVIKVWPLPDAEFELNEGREFWTNYIHVEFQPKNYLKILKQ